MNWRTNDNGRDSPPYTAEELQWRALLREFGGSTHGPSVETVSIPEMQFFELCRRLAATGNQAGVASDADREPWTKEWPTEPGVYWFYGKLSGKPRLLTRPIHVEVWRREDGQIGYAGGAQFMFPGDGTDGFWARTSWGPLPDISHLAQ